MRFVYMWPYQGEILEYSGKNKIDPFLVAAVIKNESNFDRKAVSKVGAIGLMQIMPDTGAWIAEQMGIKNFDPQDLYRTDANIRLGCWYLGELEYEFQRNWVLMMIAYNAGRGNTKAWMQENNWGYDFNRIEDIPYSDTREYVRKVLYDRDEYYKLYKNRLKKY
jgi:soluble lytic murein transglycosylase